MTKIKQREKLYITQKVEKRRPVAMIAKIQGITGVRV